MKERDVFQEIIDNPVTDEMIQKLRDAGRVIRRQAQLAFHAAWDDMPGWLKSDIVCAGLYDHIKDLFKAAYQRGYSSAKLDTAREVK